MPRKSWKRIFPLPKGLPTFSPSERTAFKRSILSAAGFLAPISAPPGRCVASSEDLKAVFGRLIYGLYARYDRDTSSWKTSLRSRLMASGWSLVVFSTRGTMRNGRLFVRWTSATRTRGSAYSSWPTPLASDAVKARFSAQANRRSMARKRKNNGGYTGIFQLAADEFEWPAPAASDAWQAEMGPRRMRKHNGKLRERNLPPCGTIQGMAAEESNWPTPLASDATWGNYPLGAFLKRLEDRPDQVSSIAELAAREFSNRVTTKAADAEVVKRGGHCDDSGVAVGGFGERPNSLLSLWLMGFPPNWLDSVHAETPSSRQSRSKSHGASSHSTQGKRSRNTRTRRSVHPGNPVDKAAKQSQGEGAGHERNRQG